MPVKMVSPRDYTLRTRTGHVIHFPANVPVHVPDVVVSEALAVNILPTSTVDTPEPSHGVVRAETITGTLRDALIFNGILQLVKENDSASFNAGGQPKLTALNALTGIRITGGELSKYWDRYREIVGTNSPFPTHPKLDLVVELQSLTTRKQLLEFANDHGIPEGDVKRHQTIKEAKEALLQATLSFAEGAAFDAPPSDKRHSTLQED